MGEDALTKGDVFECVLYGYVVARLAFEVVKGILLGAIDWTLDQLEKFEKKLKKGQSDTDEI